MDLLDTFDTGGTHDENPFGGIPIGQSANGMMNTVEQGETRFNGYIFSNRLELSPQLIKKYSLPKKLKGKTPATASKKLNEMSKESNSSYDHKTTIEMLERLIGANEELRMEAEEKTPLSQPERENQMFFGGFEQTSDLLGIAADGASMLGPWGAAAGAATKIGLSIFGNSKAEKEAREQADRDVYSKNNEYRESDFALGGYPDPPGKKSKITPEWKSYQDSLALYEGMKQFDTLPDTFRRYTDAEKKRVLKDNLDEYNRNKNYPNHALTRNFNDNLIGDIRYPNAKEKPYRSTKIAPIGNADGDMNDRDNWNAGFVDIYKKPTRPDKKYIPEDKVPTNNQGVKMFRRGGMSDPPTKKKFDWGVFDIFSNPLNSKDPMDKPTVHRWEKVFGNDPMPGLDSNLTGKGSALVKPTTKIPNVTAPETKTTSPNGGGPGNGGGSKRKPEPQVELEWGPRGIVPMGSLGQGENTNPFSDIDPLLNRRMPSPEARAKAEDIVRRQENKEKFNSTMGKIGDAAGQAARYAPTATNLWQLNNMEKPAGVRLDRLDGAYSPDFQDVESLMNPIRETEGNMRRGMMESSGGDIGALRSNLLAGHLQTGRLKSGVAQQTAQTNRGESRFAKQFDQQNQTVNMQQANLETDINDRNEAAFDTNRSRLISQIGQDVGNIGLEQTRKKYPESAGMFYDWLGRYIEEKKADGVT